MQSIKKRLVLNYCIIIFLTVFVLAGLFIIAVSQYYYGSVEQVLVERSTVSAAFYNKYLPNYLLKDKAKYILENIAKEELARVEVIDRLGNIIVDSNGFAAKQKVTTPDFQKALEGETGIWKGKKQDTGERILAIANPLLNGNRIVGVLRYVASLEGVHAELVKINTFAVIVSILVILLTLVLSQLLARSIINPIKEVTKVAEQMALGSFSIKATKRYNDEIGKLADTLNYMATEIIKTEKIKNDFLSSISHELRTPLTSIKGWGETLLSAEAEDLDETKQGLEIICNETERMIGLVEELLDFSKFQSGRIKIISETVDINQLVEEVKQQFEIGAKEKQIELVVRIDAKRLEIKGDFNRLKQVLINLLDNALKFTSPKGKVQITAKEENNRVKIEVSDTGEGIASDDLPRITNKFFKGSIKRPGSGLGLSIVQEIVSLHHGKLEITSTLGWGTKVTIILPKT